MSAACLGKLLVSLLLVLCSGRIFFVKRERVDSLSTISIAAFVASVLQVAAHGADAVSAALCIVALFSLFTNIHALSRLASGVFIDHYNPLFIVFSLISLLLSAFLCFVTVYFAPAVVSGKMMREMSLEKEAVRYTLGEDGTYRRSRLFEVSQAEVLIYKRRDTVPAARQVVILVTDKRAGQAGYEPYMAFLAEKGFTVITGEFGGEKWFAPPFGARPFRRLAMVLTWLFDRAGFDRQREFYTFASKREYEALLKIAALETGKGGHLAGKCYLVSDDMSSVAADTVEAAYAEAACVFPLEEMLVAPGLGFVQQADPLLSWHLHLEDDRGLDAPREAAMATVQMFHAYEDDAGGEDDTE